MRRLIVSFVVVAPLIALAQEEEGAQEDVVVDDPTPDEEFGGGPREGGDTPNTAPETHTVVPGDTLWGLSNRYLNNPFYWPKIWSYNPQLDNPNWIRPGTVIRFYPGEQVVEEPPDDDPEFDDIGEGGGFEAPTNLNTDVRGSDIRRREFFIPPDRLDDAGAILNSPEEKQMLADNDRVYVKLKKQTQPGAVLQIFRKERDLRHPVTGANVGTIVVMTGETRIDQKGSDQSLGTIVSSWDVIEREHLVGELPVATNQIRRVENTKNVKGYVVDAAPSPLSFLGDGYIIVIDKGSQDGVQMGNTFTILRAGDPYTREYSGMTDETIGELIVVETFKNSSTALLSAASRVIVPGDRIEMRPGN